MTRRHRNHEGEVVHTASGETVIRVRKKRRKHASHASRKKKGPARIAGIVLCVVLAVILVVCGIAYALYRMGQSNATDAMKNADVQQASSASSVDQGKTVKYNGHTYVLNDDVVSILFIGQDSRSTSSWDEQPSQSDAIMVFAFDTNTGKASVIGIPRDTMCDVQVFGLDATYAGISKMQICLAYAVAETPEESSENVARAASNVLYGIPISYYLTLDLNGIGPLNDAIDGVSLTPIETIPGTSIYEGSPTTLWGDNAKKYVQYRDTSVLGSSLQRHNRQAQYIRAFFSQALAYASGDVSVLVDLFNIAQEYSVTNLGVADYTYLAATLISKGITDIDITTLPGEMQQGEVYAEYYLDDQATYETVLSVYYKMLD